MSTIVSSIGAYNYKLAKYLSTKLTPLITTTHCAKDSFSVVEELKQLKLEQGNYIVSFDIVSLFTNIPLQESIDLAVDLLLSSDSSIKMSKMQMKKLFHFATSQTHFSYLNQYYDQVDGVAMGSPLGPTLANLFMGKFESEWLSQLDPDCSPLYYRRYVDDIFCVLKSKEHLDSFLLSLNSKHPNIKFTAEEEQNGCIPFLDILITRNSDSTVNTTTYCKPTNTGLLTNFTSFTDYTYKNGLIRTLTDRARKINSTAELLKHDLKRITTVLQKNMFPFNIINRVVRSTQQDSDLTTTDQPTTNSVITGINQNTRYYKLPYIGYYSKVIKGKVNNMVSDFCLSETSVKLIFNQFKVGQYFSLKDTIPSDLTASVVYKFQCASCNACYIGETARHLSIRVDEHLNTDTSSHVFKHLQENPACKLKCNSSCFTVVDRAASKYQLRIKEALAIKEHAPALNRQVYSYKTKLLL